MGIEGNKLSVKHLVLKERNTQILLLFVQECHYQNSMGSNYLFFVVLNRQEAINSTVQPQNPNILTTEIEFLKRSGKWQSKVEEYFHRSRNIAQTSPLRHTQTELECETPLFITFTIDEYFKSPFTSVQVLHLHRECQSRSGVSCFWMLYTYGFAFWSNSREFQVTRDGKKEISIHIIRRGVAYMFERPRKIINLQKEFRAEK